MADKRVPKYQDILWPTLVALRQTGGSASNEELSERVASIMGLSDKVLEIPHKTGSRTSFEYRSAWARSHLKLIGAVDNSQRGVWALTERGRSIASEDEVRNLVKEARANRRRERRAQASELDDDEVLEESAHDWRDVLLSIVRQLDPSAFERLCQRILRESGFAKVEILGRSGDGGIDGAGVLRLNLLSFHVRFQCKRYSGTVGAPDIRDFRGAMVGRADKGLFITAGRYSKDAEREAVRDGAPPIDLIDGLGLCELLKQLNLGVETKSVEQVTPVADFFRDL